MARLTKKAVIEAINKYDGNISAVARQFKVDRNTVYAFVKERYPDLWELVEQKREEWLDDAESELRRQANEDGNTTALIFFLKTQGKRRGYTERQEITGADGDNLVIRVKVNREDE